MEGEYYVRTGGEGWGDTHSKVSRQLSLKHCLVSGEASGATLNAKSRADVPEGGHAAARDVTVDLRRGGRSQPGRRGD